MAEVPIEDLPANLVPVSDLPPDLEIIRLKELGAKADTEAERQKSEFDRLRQAGQRSAMQEPAFRKLAGAVIPTVAGAASMLPGVGPVAGATIQAGGTAFNQLAGLEPFSLTEILKSGAIPLGAQGIIGGLKGATKALGKFVNPGATRTAGVEAAVQKMGAKPNAINRAYTPKASTAAYATVKAIGDDVPTDAINTAILGAIDDLPKANTPKAAQEYLTNLFDEMGKTPNRPYSAVHKEISGMYERAKDLMKAGEGESGAALMSARAKIIDELDKVSPALKTANALYRKEQATERVAKVLSNPRPDVKLAEMLQSDPLTRGVVPYADAKMLEKIARQIATMGTQASPYGGLGGRTLNLLAAPLAALAGSPVGMSLLRQTFKDGKVTQQGLATVAQFMRAYQAQGEAQ